MLVLLDRDGVINRDRSDSVKSLDEFEMLEGSAQAIARLNAAGVKVAVVTNQSVVGKGLISQQQLDQIHSYMQDALATSGAHIDALYVCTDHPDVPTHRRKPAPGMIEEALVEFAVEACSTPVVGDALRDLQAAEAAGCPHYLVQTGKGKTTLANGLPEEVRSTCIMADLSAAVDDILSRYGSVVGTML